MNGGSNRARLSSLKGLSGNVSTNWDDDVTLDSKEESIYEDGLLIEELQQGKEDDSAVPESPTKLIDLQTVQLPQEDGGNTKIQSELGATVRVMHVYQSKI